MSDNHYYYGGAPMGGVNSGFGFGNGNGIFDLAALLIVGGIFGGFGWGGGFGGFGGGAAGLAGTTTAAAETAAMISQQNTSDRVAAIGADVRQVLGQTGGIIEAVNTVGNRTQDGFARLDTSLCQLGHAQSMQSMNNYNGLTGQLTEMRFANQQCCCDTKGLIQSSFCDLRHQMQMDKCATDALIVAEGEKTRALIRDIDTAKLREELTAAKAQLSQNAQTAAIVSAVQAQCGPKCGMPYGTSNCGCNPCGNLLCSVQNAFADEIAQRIVNPTTTAAA
jgi:hypothetical protein